MERGTERNEKCLSPDAGSVYKSYFNFYKYILSFFIFKKISFAFHKNKDYYSQKFKSLRLFPFLIGIILFLLANIVLSEPSH
jgi:hypothetical protein